MTGRPVPQRLAWAAQVLAAAGAREVLEVGCGRGVAVRLLCDRLPAVRVTALDRSPTMVEAARRACGDLVAAGRVDLRAGALADVDLGASRFDAVFAVNVNAFWVGPSHCEVASVRELLAPDGGLYLFYEPPGPQQRERLRPALHAGLALGGFTATDLPPPAGASATLLGVVARRRP